MSEYNGAQKVILILIAICIAAGVFISLLLVALFVWSLNNG